jgi:hypothetical protein
LRKIGRGNQKIGIIRVVCTTFCRISADYRAKHITNHPDNTYLMIPSTDFFQNYFFGKLLDHTITGYAHISWQLIYSINKAVAFRGGGSKSDSKAFGRLLCSRPKAKKSCPISCNSGRKKCCFPEN